MPTRPQESHPHARVHHQIRIWPRLYLVSFLFLSFLCFPFLFFRVIRTCTPTRPHAYPRVHAYDAATVTILNVYIILICVFYLHNVCFFFSILPNFFDHNVFFSPQLFFFHPNFFFMNIMFFSFQSFPLFLKHFFFFFTPTFFFYYSFFFPMTPDFFYVMKTMLLFFD